METVCCIYFLVGRNYAAKALKKIVEKRDKQDPLEQPIASVTISLQINVENNKTSAGRNLGAPSYIGLGKGTQAILSGNAAEFMSDADGHYQILFACPVDDPYMGKPIRSLVDAEYIQMEFLESVIPLNTKIGGGKIVFVINNQVTLKCDIPAQVVKDKLDDHPAFLIKDIQSMLKPLFKNS